MKMNDPRFDVVVGNLDDILDDPDKFDSLCEQAAEANQRKLWDDPEWTTQRFTSLKEIVTAFMVGTMGADAWFKGYSVPPNFEMVVNAMCGAVVVKFGENEFCNASLLDIEAFYHEFIDAIPLCREWNDFPGSGFISAASPAPSERVFIDLDALIRNAAVYIRDDRRTFDAFNEEFEQATGTSGAGGETVSNPQETLEPRPRITYPLRVEPEPGYEGVACILGADGVLIAAMLHPEHAENIVTTMNARVRDSAAATLEKDRDLAYADGYNDGFRHGKQSRAAVSTEECETKCEHGVLWTMECLSCGPSDYAAAASPIALRDEVHDHTWEGSNNGSGVSYLCSDPDCRVGIDQVTE